MHADGSTNAEQRSVDWEFIAQAELSSLRLRVLQHFIDNPEHELSPRDIADELKVGISGVSYHVRELATARIIVMTRELPVRGSVQHFYVLTSQRERERAQPD